MTTDDQATLKFQLDVGAIFRGQIRAAIETYCWKQDLQCNVIEHKTFWESTFLFTITGPHDKITTAKTDIGNWLEKASQWQQTQ